LTDIAKVFKNSPYLVKMLKNVYEEHRYEIVSKVYNKVLTYLLYNIYASYGIKNIVIPVPMFRPINYCFQL